MRKIDSANKWPGFSELLCEVSGSSKTWSNPVKEVVVRTLREQYTSLDLELPKGFDRLESPKVTTVTTGHQLQLFGGPAFLHYKTITAIRKASELSSADIPIVPVFWMASEDHDFDEISWVYGETAKHQWMKDSGSMMVGDLSLDGLLEAFENWSSDCDIPHQEIRDILQYSISRGESYGSFFIRLMHLWYGDTGLVVIDGSHKNLKSLFAMEMSSELSGDGIASYVLDGKITPREINLFHAPTNGPRVGVIPSDNGPVSNGEIVSGESPEELSPSVLLRPLYQEKLLPNSYVILGPSEIKYWQQLTPAFEKLEINMPTLYLRDHVLVLERTDLEVFERLGWSLAQGWWSKDEFVRIIMDGGLESRFGLKLEDLIDDEKLLRILEEFKIEFGSELGSADAPTRVKSKVRKTAIKKVKRHLKEVLSEEIDALSTSLSKVMNGRIPQDRWGNFHVLSRSVGGFKNLRDKLLETTDAEGAVMQVIVAD
jgi:hypothetical protein